MEVIQICCGENHTICLAKNGDMYSWGANQNGQLGHNDSIRYNRPEKMKFFEHKQVQEISSGKKHSFALTKEGFLYGWGGNEFG